MSTSIYDIPLKTWDDKPDMLEAYKNKVTLFINVTTNCGNAPEYGIIEEIYQTYKPRGFEVVAIPTNEYCGEHIVYDEFVNGITCAADARDYAIENYYVTYNFSELVYSNPGKPDWEKINKFYPNRTNPFPIQLPEGQQPHPIYRHIYSSIHNNLSEYECGCEYTFPHKENQICGHGSYMFGNFEKYLFTRSGKFVRHYANGNLMPRFGDIEYAMKYGLYTDTLREDPRNPAGDDELYGKKISGQDEYDRLCMGIEELL